MLASVSLCAFVSSVLAADGGKVTSPLAKARQTVARGLDFLQKDAAKWKAEKQCSTCHHGVMTLWALSEAKRQGYAVDSGLLAETAKWTKERLAGIDKPRDPRPGWNMINTTALYLAVMAQNQPGQDTLSAEELTQIADHAGRHLEEDGSVMTPATMSPPRPQNGPPPVFQSREVHTLLAVLAMQREGHDPKEASAVQEARKKAGVWLASTPPGEDTQALDLRLLVAVRNRKPRKELNVAIADILKRQNADGGWGQLRDLPSDAYATGQTLYALSLAGVDARKREIERAVSFLVSNQKEDGSWPMTPRAHPGAKPSTNPSPILHAGSCWAVIGLVRSIPNER